MRHIKIFATIITFWCSCLISHAQENVGIGTLTPNPSAILDLSANNKGFLLPRMTIAERDMLADSLDVDDSGLLIFVTDEDLFYYWDSTQWSFFPYRLADDDWIISGNDMVQGTTGNVGIGVASPLAKLHTDGTLRFESLSATTNNDVLTIANNGNVGKRFLGDDIWDGDDVIDDDASATNECNIALFYNSNTNILSIQDACGIKSTPITITSNDFDKDSTNELQSLFSSSIGTNVTVDISSGLSTTFSIADGDASQSNELQTLTLNQVGTTINWNLNRSGGSGSFNLDDQDWAGAGTGSMYPFDLQDDIGIGMNNPSFKLDVNGDIRTNDKLYLSTTDYYIENNSQDLYFSSDNNMRFVTNEHTVRYYASGGTGIVNFEVNGNDILTVRGTGTNGVGIGTATPTNRLQVAGNVRVGEINPPGFTNGGNNYGNRIYFSGGPGYTGANNITSDNNDTIFIARYNVGPNASELRIGIGDDHDIATASTDRLSIGTHSPGNGINSFRGLFDFEMENPGTSNGPMLSISPFNSTHQKSYHGGLTITKPLGTNGQYINLARGASTVWSIGYQYGTSRFAISEGSTNDAAFAVTNPHFTIATGSGYVGLGVTAPSNRIELPNENSSNGKGRANAWINYSDGRFKKNREQLGTIISKVMKMNPLTYQWEKYKNDENGQLVHLGELRKGIDYGFIAQELYELFPEMVSKPKDESKDTWAIDYPRLTVILTKAIQEQQVMLETEQANHQQTKSALDELKAEVELLKSGLEALQQDAAFLKAEK